MLAIQFRLFLQAVQAAITFDQWFVMVLAVLMSAVFAYVPGVKDWYEKQSDTIKRAIMAGGMLVIAALTFWLGCIGFLATLAGLFGYELPPVSCDLAGGLVLLKAFLIAVGANQGFYWLAPGTKSKSK